MLFNGEVQSWVNKLRNPEHWQSGCIAVDEEGHTWTSIAGNERTGIVIGLPMTTAEFNDSNPFAIKFKGPRNVTSYVLGYQPKSFDWRMRGAKAHPWKRVPDDVFAAACEQLNQIIAICD